MLRAYKIYYRQYYRQFKKIARKFLVKIKLIKPVETKQKAVITPYPNFIEPALSLVCQAKCIYCPDTRGQSTKEKFMAVSLVEKILADTAGHNYQGSFSLSQNGEATLNPEFLKIFRLIRKFHPKNKITLFSNMGPLTKNLGFELLSLGLDELHFNIDGATAKTYAYVKGLDFEKIKKNIFDFLESRKSLNANCRIFLQIMSANRYEKSLGKKPRFPDDTLKILKFWQKYLLPSDEFVFPEVAGWAERDKKKIKKSGYCRIFPYTLDHMYINSDGRAYLCDQDDDCLIFFGNLYQQSIKEIWQAEKRKKILNLLADREFDKIGPPCSICLEKKI